MAVFSWTMKNQMEGGIYSVFCYCGQQKNSSWILLVSPGTGSAEEKGRRGTGRPSLRGSFLTSPLLVCRLHVLGPKLGYSGLLRQHTDPSDWQGLT